MKMAAPLASKAGSAGTTSKPPFPELDFRSGARVEELNKLIQEFTKHDQREYDDQRALEIHTAKDFIFSMLGCKTRSEWSKSDCGGGVFICVKL
ncbi:protein MB21D2 [Turdus rufiventris]|nr:protein MB21D2 [Turdus rufiventris]